MQLPKTYFENLTPSKYREYLKLLPPVQRENTKAITMLILTFFALSFFGFFAIKPTLSTIIELHKQLDDSELVQQQLATKIANLSRLQQQYNLLGSDLPVILDAIPSNPAVPQLVGQIQALARQDKLVITSLRVSEVDLTTKKPSPQGSSFVFSLEAQGSYENMLKFVNDVSSFNRIVTLDSITLAKDSKVDALVLSIKGRQYFKANNQ